MSPYYITEGILTISDNCRISFIKVCVHFCWAWLQQSPLCTISCHKTSTCISEFTHTHTHTQRERERERERERDRERERERDRQTDPKWKYNFAEHIKHRISSDVKLPWGFVMRTNCALYASFMTFLSSVHRDGGGFLWKLFKNRPRKTSWLLILLVCFSYWNGGWEICSVSCVL